MLDKIIGPGTHLEMEFAPHDLFELIWSIRGDHLHGNQCWDQLKRKFDGQHIQYTDYNSSYTRDNVFKKSTPPSTIHLIHKHLERRTGTEFLTPTYILVYTHKEHPQLAHVDLSTSIFVPNKKLDYIMHLPISAKGMWLRI